MTTSQDWWPADYGHYGPLFIRMALARRRHLPHRRRPRRRRRRARSASRRSTAGPTTPTSTRRAGCCGRSSRSTASKISWADLLVLAGNVRAGVDGLQDVRLRLRPRRTSGSPRRSSGAPRTPGSATSATAATASSQSPLGAVQMGLIYVNPEGPNGNPDPLAAARDIRETFAPHGDERRGDRRADRRRPHLRQDPRRRRPGDYVGPEPEGAPIEQQGLGWKNSFGTGKGARHDHQRPRGRLDARRRPSGTTASSTTCSATSGS